MKGFIQIYYGNGKGKSTSIAGLILRALPHNFKIALFRFFKPPNVTSEDKILKNFKKNLKIYYPKYPSPMFNKKNKIDEIKEDEKILFNKFVENMKNYDIIILDEGLDLIKYKIISSKELIKILKNKPENLEIVLTGHYIDRKIKKIADLITEFKNIKHYYQKGIKARRGIEY